MALADAPEDGKIRPRLPHAIDEGGKIAHESITHAINLVVPGVEVAALVPGIVELERLHLLDGIRLKSQEGGHGISQFLLDDGFEPSAHHNFFVAFLQDFKGLDVGIMVGIEVHPVEIVILIDVRIRCKSQFITPTLEKAPPEEVADGYAIAFLVAKRLLHAFELGNAVVCAFHAGCSCYEIVLRRHWAR